MRTKPYTRKEAADQLNISLRQLDRHIAAGELQKVRTSARRTGITQESLRAYLAELNKTDADAPADVAEVKAVYSAVAKLLSKVLGRTVAISEVHLGVAATENEIDQKQAAMPQFSNPLEDAFASLGRRTSAGGGSGAPTRAASAVGRSLHA